MKVNIKGKVFEVASEPADYWGWITEGRYNREFEVYDRYLKPEHTFVDLGAWVGGHSLYGSSIVKRVVAVEPDPVAYDILKLNAKDANIVHLAVSDVPGVVKLGSGFLGASTTRFNPNAGSGIGPWEAGHDFEIEAITLRELVKDLPDPLFIKIDVEGAEERIFKDVALFAERAPVVLVELHPWWWENPTQAQIDFQTVRSLYDNPISVFHNTWVFCD